MGEKLTATGNIGQYIVFFVFAFLHIFQKNHVRLGEKRKILVFTGVYVCVKAKLTLVSFFPLLLHLFLATSGRKKENC